MGEILNPSEFIVSAAGRTSNTVEEGRARAVEVAVPSLRLL